MLKLKGIVKQNLDFIILDCLDLNLKTLIIKDNSDYGWSLERLYIEVLFLGFIELKTAMFILNQVNVFNSNTLGFSEKTDNNLIDLEDGLYWISYLVSLHNYNRITKLYLRTIKFDCKYDNLLLKLSFNNCEIKEDESIKKTLLEIDLMKSASLANVRNNNIEKGIEIFKKANKSLEKLENKLSN